MKQPLLLILFLLSTGYAVGQNCKRDSTLLLNDSNYVSPEPYTAAEPLYLLKTACINKPYNQSVTLKVPAQFIFQGIPLTVTSASIATTGAITGLPSGLGYSCDPPNCLFNAGTLGCILINGTPNNPAQAPDTVELTIKAKIASVFGVFDITFPGPVAPGNYYLFVYTEAACSSSADEAASPLHTIFNTPNPFTDQTTFHVDADTKGEFQFRVYNFMGQQVAAQQVPISPGNNQFQFDASGLTNGAYFFVLGNHAYQTSGKMLIAR